MIERAIKFLESRVSGCFTPESRNMYKFIMSVLQEKQEREKGCKWCMRGEHRDVVGNAHNYCPWCGRKLIEGAEHEEE